MLELITQEALKTLLNYNPDTGIFTWLNTCGGRKVGSIAGAKHPKGYIRIQLKGRTNLAHRLAWVYMTGNWPTKDIDHINGIRDDNRFSNLREATRSENMQNLKQTSTSNRTGYLGVYTNREKFSARITINGVRNHLGTYNTAEEASEAYLKAKGELHPYSTI